MSKQDINAVRTPQDLEIKYDLGSIAGLKKNYEIQKKGLTKVENELNDFVKVTTKDIEEIKNQVDGNITTWFSSGIPTLENYPTNEWITVADKSDHLGDLYYDQDTGYAYRFIQKDDIFSWLRITDSDVTEALAIANAAKDTADRKRQVFVVQPTPPYDVGDLWIKDEEIYRCQTSRPDGESFEDNDWIKATKYTDDTVANQVNGKLTILSGTVTEIRQDVDELTTTMTNTTKVVDEQGNTIGTLQEKQTETSQTVDSITSRVSTVENDLVTTNSNLSDLSDVVNTNTTNIGNIKTNVSELQQTDEQIKASVESIDKQIIPTTSATGSNIYVEDASDNPLIQLEIEGKSTQETRSGKNLVDINKVTTSNCSTTIEKNSITVASIESATTSRAQIPLEYPLNTPLTISFDASILSGTELANNPIVYLRKGSTSVGRTDLTKDSVKHSYSTTIEDGISESGYELWIYVKPSTVEGIVSVKIDNLQVEEGTTATEYEVFGSSPSPEYPSEIESVGTYNEETGKYKIEVKTVGKNLFDKNNYNLYNGYFSNNTITANTNNDIFYIECNPNTKYTVSKIESINFAIACSKDIPTANIELYGRVNANNQPNATITTGSDAKYLVIWARNSNIGGEITRQQVLDTLQIEEGSTATEYEPYKSNTTQIQLNESLRSLPNGIKDIAYIKNNKLYVDRYVGSVILDEAESWIFLNNVLYGNVLEDAKIASTLFCTHFEYGGFVGNTTQAYNKGNNFITSHASIANRIFLRNDNLTTLEEWNHWLSTHNTQVDYELETTITEEYGEIEMLKTFKGINNITTTDDLEPIIKVEYVRDTILSNYVEGQIDNLKTIEERQYSELVIENNQIKESVTETNRNLSDMTGDIHTVQEILTSQEKTIEVISTNIDKTTGEIREVTTINGYKFNKDGLNIYTNENSFNTLIDNEGTYYKDGETIISETTKDGFMATNIKNKGGQEYCYDDTNKVYEFVKERIEVDGEYGYATFYNGVN